MSNPLPVEGSVVVVCVYTVSMETCPYFNNLKFDVFDAVFLSASLARLD